ncbi:MAG: Xaa-Pro dipeptidase family enzyme [Candidatus Saccharicenans subterraneus]|uniref:Xaa-Pro dipeptidase family enzyme n=1 Tax=Candidatus Saccharicenans subterraneus TaxID=2508984 RepID=A0A3E2BQT4_9BACT|nr:MAG: Xaa-Pro dipeptidase family enzyme [Candidatus Saccharicenans subterraneum]
MAIVFSSITLLSAQNKATPPEEKPLVALVGGTLIDGTGKEPVANTVILIEGDKIKEVGLVGKVKIPKDAQKIDASGKWILPGFIDCHIHLSSETSDLEYYRDSNSLATLRALQLMNTYLRCGVTAVRDVGSHVEAMQALLRAQRNGYIDSIRLYPCGNLITITGGHGYGMHGSMAVDGPWEWRKAVRQMYAAGFKYIKISPQFTLEEARAAVEEARMLGLHITAHGGGFSDTIPTTMTRIAVEAGVECIEHWNEMTDDVLDLMAERGVFDVPTLYTYYASYQRDDISRFLIEKRGWSMAMHETLFKKAYQRKIVMGIGTDANGEYRELYPQIYFEEMKYFQRLGMSPMEVIVCATKNGARILGLEDELGTIEAGKAADLQILKGDPLKSFDNLGSPETVILRGKIYRFKENI